MEIISKPTDCLEFWCESLIFVKFGEDEHYECEYGIDKFKYCKVRQILKYKNNYGWCSYPFCEGGGIDYCWGFATDVDNKVSKTKIHEQCKNKCEYYKEKRNTVPIKIIIPEGDK
jgi:hypothetical protein